MNTPTQMLNMDIGLNFTLGILHHPKILHHKVKHLDLQEVQRANLSIDSFLHLLLMCKLVGINLLYMICNYFLLK
jgi:hypothetical protein